MRLSALQLNRATLARQSLLHRERTDATAAIRSAVALQSQTPVSPYLGLWNRIADFAREDLDAAYAEGRVVRGNPVRMTLHTVAAADYRTFREATEPSLYAAKLGARTAGSGVAIAEAERLTAGVLDFAAEPRAAGECETWLAERLGPEAAKAAWVGIRQYAPLLRAVGDGPWGFTDRVAVVAAPDRPTLGDREAADAALQQLALRYLSGFGPASAADLAQFAMVQRGRAKQALLALGDRLEQHQGPAGETLFDLPGAVIPEPDTLAPPRLMAMWDNVFLAYFDRSRTIPPELRTDLIRNNGDVLPMLLVDGLAAGVWRATERGIEATAFRPIPDEAWAGLAKEAAGLKDLLADREPEPYRRHHYWWAKFPEAETVLLE
ncbi:winged helix DNA-binding domain-containing protein [Glycomyces sp. NRRL B-16210]|uniref:winged helix DNA-binding domain-containing protein n=1 Tax=Glycomyces sp. NRRL B-16210 TaxID=1463821 RepID=UPI0004C0770C|nr:winged helix DNA-binding domain-containing protein [Glycomyces sp. NRRL B-16210]